MQQLKSCWSTSLSCCSIMMDKQLNWMSLSGQRGLFTLVFGNRRHVSRSKSKKTRVGVGIAVGVVGIIALLGCGSLFILRRRKRLISHAKSKDLHSTPSNSNTDSNRDLPSSNGFTTAQTSGFTTTHATTGFATAHTTSYSQNIPSYASSKLQPEKGSTYFGVQVFSYTELEGATNNFDKSRELGGGGFGAVYYGMFIN